MNPLEAEKEIKMEGNCHEAGQRELVLTSLILYTNR